MKIAVIQASSQISKNELLYKYTKKYAKNSEVINYGCFSDDFNNYSYLEIALLIGILINEKLVDFAVTGCSSGQGMMLACNSTFYLQDIRDYLYNISVVVRVINSDNYTLSFSEDLLCSYHIQRN